MLPSTKYKPEDVLRIAWQRRWLILLPAAIGATLAALYGSTLPNRYESETVILVVPQRVPETYVRSTVSGRIEDRLQSISPQILSRSRLERIINEFHLYAERRRRQPIETIVERMRDDIDVEVVKGDAFRVRYAGSDPLVVANVTNRLASLFIEENLKDRTVAAEGADQFLETQLEDARKRLVDHEKKLESYRLAHAGELPSQADTNLQAMRNAQMEIQALTDSIDRDRDRRLILERAEADFANAADPPSILLHPNAAPAAPTTRELLDQATIDLRELERKFTAEHPDVVRAKRAVGDLQAKLTAERAGPDATAAVGGEGDARQRRRRELRTELERIDSQIAAREGQIQRLRGSVAEYQSRLDSAPKRETEMVELMRDYSTLQAVYTSLLQRREDAKMSVTLERRQVGEQFKLLDPAKPAERPSSPNRLRIVLIALVAGLALGLGIAALLEYRDAAMRTADEVLRAVRLPVIVTVPLILSDAESSRRRTVAVWVNIGAALLIGACGTAVILLLRLGSTT